jgi:hypothetical protein
MTNEERLIAALEYQRAMQPAFGNPNLMRQGQRMNLPARQVPGPVSEFGTQAVSFDQQPDQGYGTMAAEMALGFVPGVGQAMAVRDIERARRDDDPLGMALAGLSLVPFGKMIGAMRGGSLGMNAAPKAIKDLMPIEYKSAMSIEPPHKVRDNKKLLSLIESMKNTGWQGRPILTYDVGRGNEALTGSHRIKAAREANIEVPIYKIKNVGDYVDANGKSIHDVGFMELDEQVKWLNKFGDKNAAKLLKQEPEFQDVGNMMKPTVPAPSFMYKDPFGSTY